MRSHILNNKVMNWKLWLSGCYDMPDLNPQLARPTMVYRQWTTNLLRQTKWLNMYVLLHPQFEGFNKSKSCKKESTTFLAYVYSDIRHSKSCNIVETLSACPYLLQINLAAYHSATHSYSEYFSILTQSQIPKHRPLNNKSNFSHSLCHFDLKNPQHLLYMIWHLNSTFKSHIQNVNRSTNSTNVYKYQCNYRYKYHVMKIDRFDFTISIPTLRWLLSVDLNGFVNPQCSLKNIHEHWKSEPSDTVYKMLLYIYNNITSNYPTQLQSFRKPSFWLPIILEVNCLK